MFSFTELRGQSSLLDKHGAIEINTEYVTRKKPAWLVLLKLLGVAAMVAVGFAIALPTLREHLPLWKAIAATAGVMLLYTGIAFFFRPEANTDNMGWCGGGMNDPTQYSDNINRFLWNLHMVLGPGRFTAETLLDFCVLAGLARGAEIIDEHPPELSEVTELSAAPANAQAIVAYVGQAGQPPALSPSRFEQPPSGGSIELSSWKYFQQS